jgi:16S rRNA (guanine(527)-N(7))-methyltransferase RsmG
VNGTTVDRFVLTIRARSNNYGVTLSGDTTRELGEYFALLMRWNERLHLVAPCSPEDFATRHVLESLLLLKLLPISAKIVDVGSGAGLPIIPCLIARPDLNATLIESSQKKSVFLREALNQLGISNQGAIIAKRFEEIPAPDVGFVTCRALDQFIPKVSTMISWAPPKSVLLLFGGERLREALEAIGTQYNEQLIPCSEKRFLFQVTLV